jgi:2-iminobutanoate/2-iminopropanoate deaminase
MGKKQIQPKNVPAPGGSYSHGIVVGDFVYTAGMGPINPQTGKVVGDDVAAQTRQVLKNLQAVLAAEGLTFDDVVKSTVHLQELHRDFAAYDEDYRSPSTSAIPCARRSAPT